MTKVKDEFTDLKIPITKIDSNFTNKINNLALMIVELLFFFFLSFSIQQTQQPELRHVGK